MDGACLELAGKAPIGSSRPVGAEEDTLIRRAQRGDRAAFDALVRRYDQKVLRLVLQVVRSSDAVLDVYQEAFLKVYRSLSSFRFKSSFSTWLYRVVMNVCLDYLRRQDRREAVPVLANDEHTPEYVHRAADDQPSRDPERVLRAREIGRRIEVAVARLSPRERTVFELRHYQGLKLRDIGDLCGTSEETAKNCLFRATQKLRAELRDLL